MKRDVKCYFTWGPTKAGKTTRVLDGYPAGTVLRVTDYKHPWDAYDPGVHNVLLLDEYAGQLPFSELLTVLEGWNGQMRARYRNKWANYGIVHVNSNLSLNDMYPDEPTERREALVGRFTEISYMDRDHKLTVIDPSDIVAGYLSSAPGRRSLFPDHCTITAEQLLGLE